MPDLKQLKNVIKHGDDSVNNVLILKKDGAFELVEGASGAGAVSHLDYVTRWETYNSNNDYVGKAAAKDENHINKIMTWAKTAWDKYQADGFTKIANPNG